MARIRKNINSHSDLSGNKNNNGNSSSSTASDKVEIKKNGVLSYWKSILGFTCFIVAAYIGYLGYLETRVNTPFDENKVNSLYHFLPMFYFNRINLLNLSGCTIIGSRYSGKVLGIVSPWTLFRNENERPSFYSNGFNVVFAF